MLSFLLLGQVVLAKHKVPINKFRSQKEVALLIYLAQTGQPHSRDFLADLLWDSRSTKQSLSNLRTVLARLRPQFNEALLITPKSVALTPENQQQVDSVILLQTIANLGQLRSEQEAITLQTALNSYQGEFLASFQLDNAPQFDEWMVMTREHIRRQVLGAFGKLAHYAISTDNSGFGLAVAHRWLQVDNLEERAHTFLIEMLLKTGNLGEATNHYEDCVALFGSQLGLEPPAQLTALIRESRPKLGVRLSRPVTFPHNLPPVYDQFFGRKTVQQEIHIRLDQPWCRLVTLVGPGGVGKTRLATTIARNRLSQYPDGVWLVELADLDPHDDEPAEAIAVEIATVLNIRLSGPQKPTEQLLNQLKRKQLLLILDNFEHLLAGVQLVVDMIQQIETLQVLVTSREALRLRAEWVIPLTGLSYPNSDLDDMSSDAVELFLARRAQQHRKAVSADDLAAIRAICLWVEGLPLAIELAAALTQHTTPQQVSNRLKQGFDELTTSFRDVPQRHQSLYQVFEMSWRTLSPALQLCLGRLALFRGGFTVPAGQAIAQATPPQMAQLSHKSLLTHHPAAERYTFHPIIRAYAAERVRPGDTTLQKHAHYYLAHLTQYTEPLQKNSPQTYISLLQPDIDNIRQAWQTALTNQNVAPLFQALTALSIYYQLCGLNYEAEATMRTTAQTALSWQSKAIPLAIRAKLEQARFQNRLGHYRLALQTIETMLNLTAQSPDSWAEAMGQVIRGEALWRLGDYQPATANLNKALTLAQSLKATLIIGWCYHHLGIINSFQGHYPIAHSYLQQACAAWQTIDNRQALSGSLNSIGLVYYDQGNFSAAQEAIEQALALCEQLGDRHRQSSLVNNLSMILTEQGDYLGAQYYLQLGLELATTNGNLTGQAELNINLGKNYRLLGEHKLALECLEQGLQLAQFIENHTLTTTALNYLADAKKVASGK